MPNSRYTVINATIASSGTVSDAVTLGQGDVLVGIEMPSGWDAANITFQNSIDGTTNFIAVNDADGNAVTVTSPAADKFIALSPVGIGGLATIKIVSSATQTAERILKLVIVRRKS